jgi:c-di-GMP-binding flagellar brake protein YcgR
MRESFHERRRTPRATVAGGHALQMPRSTTVQLVDISLGGVLLSSPQALEPGGRATLQTQLGTKPVQAEVEVCQVSPERAAAQAQGRFRVGARFVALGEPDRRAVQQFLRADVP